MAYLYKSTTGRTLNIGSYIVTGIGVSYDTQRPELEVEGVKLVILGVDQEPTAAKNIKELEAKTKQLITK